MFFESGQIQRIILYAYTDSTYPAGKEVSTLKIQVNPETISRKSTLSYKKNKNPGAGQPAVYYKSEPEEFSFDILLDQTGVVKDAGIANVGIANPVAGLTAANDITNQVLGLRKCLYDVSGDAHRPYFVKVYYGKEDLTFKGVLTSFNIDYKLFSPNGNPLRAVAHITLRGSEDPNEALAAQDNQSPDITHQRIFKAGSQLPLMSDDIYKDVNRYIDVAKANKLLSFRKIEVGTIINFPPVK